jgi:SAM-dependent methyltransferase
MINRLVSQYHYCMFRDSLRKIYYGLSPSGRMLARKLWFGPADVMGHFFGRENHPLLPPRHMIYTGAGDFLRQGKQFRSYFEKYAGLHPGSRVLDVGCGIGRMAVPLTEVLHPDQGFYEGFDVVKTGIDWCQNRITPDFPHFRFQYVPLLNDLYRTDGGDATTFRFPYPDAHFDLVILTSVFTHMLPDETEHYLKEIHRVLQPGGRVFASFFLWNETAEAHRDRAGFKFPHDLGHYRLMSRRVKSANVAYDETYLRQQVKDLGYTIAHLHYGTWSGRPRSECLDFQDIIVLEK